MGTPAATLAAQAQPGPGPVQVLMVGRREALLSCAGHIRQHCTDPGEPPPNKHGEEELPRAGPLAPVWFSGNMGL